MKTYTLKRNSWHYWLAKKGGLWEHDTDICTYIRKVINGTIKMLAMCVAAAVSGVVVILGTVNLVSAIFYGVTLNPVGVIVIGVLVAMVLIFSAFVYVEKILPRLRRNHIEKEPGFITLAYHKFKDKTCVRVRIEQ